MLYLFLSKNRIRLLNLKKSIMNQYESLFFEKEYQTDLLDKGQPANVDLIASAIKEAINSLNQKSLSDKDVVLILPQESFSFFRCQVPADIAVSAMASFIKDRARASLRFSLDNCLYDYFIEQSDNEKQVNFFAIEETTVDKLVDALKLIDLKLTMILPETIAYFKLFEKTLRKEKKENIFFVNYEDKVLSGYVFDSSGLLLKDKWKTKLGEDDKLESILKQKADQLAKDGKKLNRLIVSGESSGSIRQDTFTKAVGVWTNPLKRIIPNFYEEYLKLFFSQDKKPFPFLKFDACLGAFIFIKENRRFLAVKGSGPSLSLPPVKPPKKEFFFFLISFALSFVFFLFVSKLNLEFLKPKGNKPTETKQVVLTNTPPTATPTPGYSRDDLKVKVLNGSGTAGKASEVKDILKKAGYGEVLTANAESFDYEITEIQAKKDKNEAVTWLKNDLKDYTSSFKQTALDDKEAADVVVIIGKDFK